MAVLREILAKFSVQFDGRQLQKGQASIASTVGSLRTLGAAMAGSYVVRGITNFVNEIRNAGDELDKSSKQIGLTVTQLQELRHAANLSGVDAAGFTQSLRLMQKNMDMAAQGNKTMSELFDRLNISIKGADGQLRTLDDIMPDLADAFMNMENPAERVAIAYQVMGRQGARMLPMFEKGAAGLAKMRAEAEKLGGGMGEDAVQAAVELTDNLARLDFAMLSVKSALAVVLLPMLDTATRALTKFSAVVKGGLANTNLLQATMIGLGGFGARALWKLLGGFKGILRLLRPLIFRLAIPILLIDDLLTLFQGGKSVIGAFIEKLMGWDAGKMQEIMKFWGEFFGTIKEKTPQSEALMNNFWKAVRENARATMGNVGADIVDAIAAAVDMVTGNWARGMKTMGTLWDANMGDMEASFQRMVNWVLTAWNDAIGGIQKGLVTIANAIDFIPGAGDAAAAIKKTLEDLKSDVPGVSDAAEAARSRLERTEQSGIKYGPAAVEAAQKVARKAAAAGEGVPEFARKILATTRGPQMLRMPTAGGPIQSTTTVNVNVPPGTPPQQARAVGNAAANGVRQGMRGTQRALAHTGG